MSDQLSADLHSLRIDRKAPPSGGRSKIVSVIIVLALLGGAGFGVKLAMPMITASVFKQEVAVTEISMVYPQQGSVDLTTTGYVVPQSISKIGAKVLGRITKSTVKEWQEVKQDQVLFVLDATDQRAAIASAQAKAMAARARAQAARASVAEVRLQYNREKQLAESGSVSKAGAEDLGARVAAMNATASAAEVEAAAQQAEVASLQSNLNNLVVKSPMDGVASTKPAQVGDVVRPDQILVEVADMRSLIVEADVAEARLSLVKMGAPCELVLDAYPTQRFRGSVIEVSPVLDRAKASAKVKIQFTDKVEVARGQMGVRVSFLAQQQTQEQLKEQPKKVVPSAAVFDKNGGKFIFVVAGDRVRQQAVNLGPAFGGGFLLLDDLPSGTKVVSNPPATLADGQAIKEAASK